MADLFGDMELAQGAGIFGHIGAVGGVNLSGLPNVGGHGTPGMRSGRQRLAVNNLHRGKPNPFQPPHAPQLANDMHQDQGHAMQQYQQPHQQPMADYMHPAALEHFNNQASSIQQTNDAIAKEMDSRVDQARDSDQMAHEEYLANMKYQSEMAGHQASMALNQQNLQAKQAKNAALMRAAGLGGQTIVNGKPVDAFDPLRSSLLG